MLHLGLVEALRIAAQHVAGLDRLVHGNPGHHRHLAAGVAELKIDLGPGYRVYYTVRGDELIVLLCGGEKASQRRDIEVAIDLARTFRD